MNGNHSWELVLTINYFRSAPYSTSSREVVKKYRSGKIAFHEFEFHNPGDWYNWPMGEKIVRVQLIRDDGMVQDKGQEREIKGQTEPLGWQEV